MTAACLAAARTAVPPAAASAARPVLRFSPQGAFKLVQFTDLHLGERDDLDEQTFQVRRAARRPVRGCRHTRASHPRNQAPRCADPRAHSTPSQA